MLIGTQYADNKLYRGIKHYDQMPLISGDLHEYSDTAYMKNAYIMNNLLGYGTMNTPEISVTAGGIRLTSPSVVMIDGDISLIQSDDNLPIVTATSVASAGYSEGIVCIVGWYQSINASSTMRNYGGVDNSVLTNDLMNSKFNLQVSSRYQFRWFPIIVNKSDIVANTLTITIDDRDIDGNVLATQSTLTSKSKINNTFITDKSASMTYAESDVYIVPILGYTYNTANSTITSTYAQDRLKAGSPFIISTTIPQGMLSDGTVWFNPDNQEFKTFVAEAGGFLAITPHMAFMRYQNVYVVPNDITTIQDITIPIGISEYQEGDILQVTYEGLFLIEGENYSVNATNKTIDLLEFTVTKDDKIQFIVTKIAEASNITDISNTFLDHMSSTGSSTVEAHVRLTDTLSTSDATKGIAATPKMVRDAKLGATSDANDYTDTQIESANGYTDNQITAARTAITTEIADSHKMTDATTSKSYKFGIDNGLLYIEEV